MKVLVIGNAKTVRDVGNVLHARGFDVVRLEAPPDLMTHLPPVVFAIEEGLSDKKREPNNG